MERQFPNEYPDYKKRTKAGIPISGEEDPMSDTLLDGSGEQVPGRRPLEGTDLEIAYNLLGDDLVLRVNKAGVQVFGVVLENAAKTMTAERLLGLKTEKSDLVVRLGTRAEAVANIGYQLGRVANRLIKLPVKRWKRLSGSEGAKAQETWRSTLTRVVEGTAAEKVRSLQIPGNRGLGEVGSGGA